MDENCKLPYNLEAERALLNALLTNSEAGIDIMEVIKEDDFYLQAHQLIYRTMLDVESKDKSIDLVTLVDLLEKKDILNKVGGISYVEGLTLALPSLVNYKNYIEIVDRDSVCRKLIKAANDISAGVMKTDATEDALKLAEELIYNISEKKDRSNLTQATPFTNEVLTKINLVMKDKNAFKGTPSYFENLDRILNGLHKSDLMLVAARPSIGKTAFSLNIVSNIIKNDPEKVIAIFSLEMASTQLIQRMIATVSRTSLSDTKRGELNVDDLKRIYQASKIINNSKLYIDDSSMINPSQILSKCRRLKAREGRLDLVVIDYLQLMVSNSAKESRQEVVSDFSRRMKVAAKELNVPLILISQLSRAVEKRDDKIPQLSDLRESGSIEQDADIVMMLHKPETEDGINDLIQLIIAKHRNGDTGSIYFKWKGDIQTFEPTFEKFNIIKSPKGKKSPKVASVVDINEKSEEANNAPQNNEPNNQDDGDLKY